KNINKTNHSFMYKNFNAIRSPLWVKKAVIYQLDIKSFTENGFLGLKEKLAYLKELGINALWIMPFCEIGIEKRVGEYGDPYAVEDFYSIDSQIGTKKDFLDFVSNAHSLNFKIIMDFPINRASIDCNLTKTNPDWFTKNTDGQIYYAIPGRDYFAGFDFTNNDLKKYLIECFKYWINEFNIDGFRFDDTDMTPHDFLLQLSNDLKETKNDILLISQSYDEFHNAESFDLTYEGGFRDIFRDIIFSEKTQNDFIEYYNLQKFSFPKDSLRLRWLEEKEQGRIIEIFGEQALYPVITVFYTLDSVPMLIMGQEFSDTKWKNWTSLFNKFSLDWDNFNNNLFNHYKKILQIRNNNIAFTECGLEIIKNDNHKVISFVRFCENKVFLIIANLSNKEVKFKLSLKNINNLQITDKYTCINLLNSKKEQINLKRDNLFLRGYENKVLEIKNI
ncbi:MAG: hypothetical protein A2Y34_10205, partial [Spirochaetes bacterium GWC1_27_15]